MLTTEEIQYALFQHADLNSDIPDINQIAEHLHNITDLVKKIPLAEFEQILFQYMAAPDRLKASLYENIILELNTVLFEFPDLLLSFWTQGNIFFQSAKVEMIKKELVQGRFANPVSYIALKKLPVLVDLIDNSRREGHDHIILIDDRANNIEEAYQYFAEGGIPFTLVHKIRPDRPTTRRLTDEYVAYENIRILEQWDEIHDILSDIGAASPHLVLDVDGVIMNTTHYRQHLANDLLAFLRSL